MVNLDLTLQCCMFAIPLLLHGFALHLLYLARATHSLHFAQRIYLTNLSFSEFIICFLAIIWRILSMYGFVFASAIVHIFQAASPMFMYHILTILLTLDRLMEVQLNVHYPLYFTKSRIYKVVGLFWGISFLFVGLLLGVEISHIGSHRDILMFFYPSFGGLCALVAFSVYTFIYMKIRKNRSKDLTTLTQYRTRAVEVTTRRISLIPSKPTFLYLPFFLVLTLVLFVVLPEMVHFYFNLAHGEMSRVLKTIEVALYVIGYSSDVMMYVLCSKTIRQIALRKSVFKYYIKRKESSEH